MRVVTLDELTDRQESDRHLLLLAAFGGTDPRRNFDVWRRRSRFVADYAGVFAAEGDRLVGGAYVVRFPYAFRDGVEVVAGLAGVSTRPDRRRAGIARALLEEVHARERAAGQRYVTLWTNRSWGAHALYERLGYRDIYSAPWAVHPPSGRQRDSAARPAAKLAGSVRVRWGRSSDLERLEALHARASRGRLGFRRGPGHLRLTVEVRNVDPPKNLLVACRDRELVGYAHVDRHHSATICGELVAGGARTRAALVGAVRRAARGGVYAFQHTPVTDHPELFDPAEFSTSPRTWWGLLARGPPSGWTEREAKRAFATGDPRFLCLAGDRF